MISQWKAKTLLFLLRSTEHSPRPQRDPEGEVT